MPVSMLVVPYVCVGLLGAAVVIALYALVFNTGSPTHRQWNRYVNILDEDLKFLREKIQASHIALTQMLSILIWSLTVCVAGLPQLMIMNGLFVFIPPIWLKRLRRQRIQRLENQLNSWIQALANALKASASLGDALASTQNLLHPPFSEEVDVLLKENQLGTPLDIAIRNMGTRIGSRTISSALATLLVARQSGGNLPHTLERAASALREMTRLEGVVRTKTAEGKAQAYVLGVVPAVVLLAINWIHPDLLIPLIETFLGNIIVGISVTLWICSIIIANRILRVDI